MIALKIALTGTHGVGKTTLANALVPRFVTSGYASVSMTPEVPRIICALAHDPTFYRRGKNNALKQALLLYGQLQYEQSSAPRSDGLLVCDRSVLDHWAYTRHFFAEEFAAEGVLDLYEALIAEYCKTYSRLFYIPIEFPPIDDGTRESDVIFQAEIDKTITRFLSTHLIPHVTVTGTVLERCSSIEEELTSLARK